MEIKNLKIAQENLSPTQYKLNKKNVAGIMIGLALALGISQNTGVTQEQRYSQQEKIEYSEVNKESYPTLRVVLENPNAIETEDARILIVNQDEVLVQYVKGYSDGYVDVEDIYLFPGDKCRVTVNLNNERKMTYFQVGEEDDAKTEYQLIIDCETQEIRVEKSNKELSNIPHL